MVRNKADVVVVGGGCMAASIVYNLARKGHKDVALVERSHLAWGSTGKSTAIVRQHYSQEVTARMALEGPRFFQNFERENGLPTGFHRTGFVIAANESQAEGLKLNVELQIQVGIKNRPLGQPN